MKKLLLFVFLLGAIPVLAQDSVADAARASKQKQTATKKVVTDDDMPSSSSYSSGVGAEIPSATDTGSWEADLKRVRTAYKQLCSDPTLHEAKSLPPEKQKLIDDATAPLQARIAREEDNIKILKAHMERLDEQEQSEIATAGKDKQKAEEIHQHYEELRNADKEKGAETMSRAAIVYKEMKAIAAECMQPGK